MDYIGYLNCVPIWLLYIGGRVTTILILKLCIKVGRRAINKEGCIGNIRNYYIGRRPEGLLIEAAAVRLELILIRERSFNTPRSGANITAFGKGGKLRIALDLSFKFEVAGLSQGHILHLFLLALHTNLAAALAKLGVYRCAPGGGEAEARTGCKQAA